MLLSGLALDWLIWYNKGMQNSRTYTPNPSAPLPYGLWLDLPFRTKGSTAIRSKAKALGARFLPNAKPHQWWLPCRFITQSSLDWLNSVNAIVGERQAPVFNTSIKWSDIDHTKPFTVMLCLPYEQKNIAKSDGAFWDAYEKAWYFPKKAFTEALFNKYAGMKAISRVIYPGNNTPSRLMFLTDDMGTGAATAAATQSTPTKKVFYLRRDITVIEFVHNENGDNTVMITRYENGVVRTDIMGIDHNFLNVQDARSLWDNSVSNGFTPCDSVA